MHSLLCLMYIQFSDRTDDNRYEEKDNFSPNQYLIRYFNLSVMWNCMILMSVVSNLNKILPSI